MTRPTLERYLINIAKVVASRSTCTGHMAVGAVAVIDGKIISTGYNGVPRGVPHCDDVGCLRLPDGKHAYLLHAEENLIAQAALRGMSLNGSSVYCTHYPCSHCAALMVQAGVIEVVYETMPASQIKDEVWDTTHTLLERLGVAVYQIDFYEDFRKGIMSEQKGLYDFTKNQGAADDEDPN